MGDDNNPRDGRNRRNILKAAGSTVGVASVYSGLATSGLAAEGGSDPDSDIQVVEATLESEASVSTDSSESETGLHPKTRELVEFVERDADLTASTEIDLTIDVVTDDDEFNRYNPAIDIVPFGSDKRDENGNGRGPHPGNGLLFVYTVAENDERIPVGTFGLVSRPVGGRGTAGAAETGRRRLTSYVLDNGDPTKAETQVVDGAEATSSDVTTQISAVCASCQTLVDAVCVGGARVLGQYGCVAACSAAFGANFIAIFGCASICSTMFTAISAVGCTAGASVICEEMTDRSPWYITFC